MYIMSNPNQKIANNPNGLPALLFAPLVSTGPVGVGPVGVPVLVRLVAGVPVLDCDV